MLIDLFIFFELITIVAFASAFFIRHELLWVITLVLAAIMMMSSFNVETTLYVWNNTLTAYEPTVISQSYPYIMTINMMLFGLSLILGLFDIITKYATTKKQKDDGF